MQIVVENFYSYFTQPDYVDIMVKGGRCYRIGKYIKKINGVFVGCRDSIASIAPDLLKISYDRFFEDSDAPARHGSILICKSSIIKIIDMAGNNIETIPDQTWY